MIKLTPEQKKTFIEEHTRQSAAYVQVALFLGALMWGIFFVVDFWMFPVSYKLVWWIRLGLIDSFVVLMACLALVKRLQQWRPLFTMLACLSVGLGVSLILLVVRPEEPGVIYQFPGIGMMLTSVATYVMFRLRLPYAFAAAGISLVVYEIVFVVFREGLRNWPLFVMNTLALVSLNVFGFISSYVVESLNRREFLSKQTLQRYSAELAGQKDELQHQKEELQEALHQLKIQETMLVQQEKLAVLGDITASVAHEISTPLFAVTVGIDKLQKYVDVLRREHDNPADKNRSDWTEYIQKVHEKYPLNMAALVTALDRIRNQVSNMKSFIKFQESMDDFNVNNELDITLSIMNFKILSQMDIVLDKAPDIPNIRGNAAQINQVFMNVIKNAVDAKKDNSIGVLRIRTYQDDQYVHIDIEDNGIGMDEDVAKRLFVERFTTKKDGTGLGLFICHDIIQRHHGRLSLKSKAGAGTTVTLSLLKYLPD